jgi:predicted negative regulator of RcsB-dependent stress response
VEGYSSEQEQIEAIKKWWKQNGKLVILGVVLGLGILFGTRAWFDYKNSIAESASIEYEQLIEELKQKNNDAVSVRGEYIISSFPNTPYAPLAALAKTKVEAGDNADARTKLQWVLDHSAQPETIHTARMRLAKVMIAQGESQQAITLLDSVDPENFLAAYEEIKGDAYIALKEPSKASVAYKKALAATPSGITTQQLQMKLNDLAPDAS